MTAELQRRFRDALPDAEGPGCASGDELWAAAAGELPFERVRTLVDHGARCSGCAEAWRILADVRRAEAGVPEPVTPRAEPPPAPPRRARAVLPLAAAALAALGAWVALRPPPVHAPPVERGDAPAAELHAESPPVQPSGAVVLRWSEVPGATSYTVTVLTPDLVVLHQALGVSGHELRLPDAVGGRSAGTDLLWNVDAVLSDGRTVASPTFQLRLR